MFHSPMKVEIVSMLVYVVLASICSQSETKLIYVCSCLIRLVVGSGIQLSRRHIIHARRLPSPFTDRASARPDFDP